MKSVLNAFLVGTLLLSQNALANDERNSPFQQLEEILPTPNTYRAASGAPGHEYWQQQVDYKIQVTIDDDEQMLHGQATITYHNQSPDSLHYLWFQLEQNRFKKDSDWNLARLAPSKNKLSYDSLNELLTFSRFGGGYQIDWVKDGSDAALPFTVVKTGMRVDLPHSLKPGEQFEVKIAWHFKIHDHKAMGGRSGYEFFPKDDDDASEEGNYLYTMAQFYPRLASYTDVHGWHNKPFFGRGEFTLEFGDYDVYITVPNDHIVASTGVLQNPSHVLTKTQVNRLRDAKTAEEPVLVVTPEEMKKNRLNKPTGTKTWHFQAKNVRDFAFASSREFIWDAQGYEQGDDVVMAMSYYPEEGNPLWGQYSTKAVIHTLKSYTHYTFDYPYPVAISVNGLSGGMEYPMISFNGPRPDGEVDKDTGERTYSRYQKYRMIAIVIHEVGHNFFPMIVNSDERQWTWMDEGLNSFLQYLAQEEWEENFHSRRGSPRTIVDYMKSDKQVPIMTNSESILQFGNNAYAKPAAALNVLRETILGRELFDYAFKVYSKRWRFKRPMPADFFRTMEDASGVDLDWFWRGWFYTTDHVDISVDRLERLNVNTKNPEIEQNWARIQYEKEPESVTDIRNKRIARAIETDKGLKDFYNEYDKFTVSPKDRDDYEKLLKKLKPKERALLEDKANIYIADFTNHGGLVMPVILQIDYEDGTSEIKRIPVEIWRFNEPTVRHIFVSEKVIKSLTVDPNWETADTNTVNNYYPRRPVESRLEIYQRKKKRNLMKDMRFKRDEEVESPEVLKAPI